MDEFVPIPDCDGYFINKNGEILSKKRKKPRIVKSYKIEKSRYKRIMLIVNNKKKNFALHRLLALTFIDNPNNHKFVDHINRIRDDNRLENLRWVNRCENNQNREKTCNNKSGHKHIYPQDSYWFVEIKHNYEWVCKSKRFKTLEEAIVYRDKKLKEINREII